MCWARESPRRQSFLPARQQSLIGIAAMLLCSRVVPVICHNTKAPNSKTSFIVPTRSTDRDHAGDEALGGRRHAKRTQVSQRSSKANGKIGRTGLGTIRTPLRSGTSVVAPVNYLREPQVEGKAGGGQVAVRPPDGEDGRTPWGFILSAATAILISYADRGNLATCILPMAETLKWSLSEQSIVLSSFFAGYAVTQVVGGTLADRYGGERVLEAGVFFWSLLTLLTPWAASMGVVPAVLVRVGLGLGEGVAFPAVHAMIPTYVPVARRSQAVAIVTAASYVGAVAAFALTPLLIQHSGWPSVFYSFGALPALWFPFWVLARGQRLPDKALEDDTNPQTPSAIGPRTSRFALPSSSPPSPSPSEVKRSSGGLTLSKARRILSSRPVLAILLAQYSQSWGMYGLLSWLPTFFAKTYDVDVASLGAFTVGPYVAQALVGVASGTIADSLIVQHNWPVVKVRKTLQVLGSLGPALFLLLATSGMPSTLQLPPVTSAFLAVTVGSALSALTLAAVSVNHLDVCPRHAGFVFGAGNTMATLAGLISVPVSGFLLEKTGSFAAVFACFAAHYVLGAGLYTWLADDKDIIAEIDAAEEAEGR